MNHELAKRFPGATYLDPTVRVFGGAEIGANASLWPYTVIRAESQHVRIGRYTNLQDHVMVHVGYGRPTVVGDFCSITHRVVLHGCTIGDQCIVGMGAVILDQAEVGDHCIIGAGALVTPGTKIPAGHVAVGSPARPTRPLREEELAWLGDSAQHYVRLIARYLA